MQGGGAHRWAGFGRIHAGADGHRTARECAGVLGVALATIRVSAIPTLAVAATDNGLLASELAAAIARVKSAKSIGVRVGKWLSLKQAQTLLNAPDITTIKGLRDRAIIAVLLGCGLRRSEVAALTMGHVQSPLSPSKARLGQD